VVKVKFVVVYVITVIEAITMIVIPDLEIEYKINLGVY